MTRMAAFIAAVSLLACCDFSPGDDRSSPAASPNVTATIAGLHAAQLPGGDVTRASLKPNVLFILTDDQGYGDVGRHGNPVLKTPNLDRLHDQSVRFTDFCVNPSCSPTRAALMSGMSNLRVGVTHTILPRCRMNPNVTILPQYLKSAGYSTACIGKWHLSADAATEPGKRGFDYVAGKPVHYQDGRYREDILFDEAIGFMERCAGKPFFCYLATWSPHAPLIVPDKYIAPYLGKVDDDTAHFFGMIANIDENLGRLMKWLDEKDLARNTIVIFMNDNGGTYGVDTWNAGMRGCKCTVWPGGARAMSLWRWPGRWQARDITALTAHVDVLPTLAEIAGARLPDPADARMEGHSLLGLLDGKDDPWFADRMVFLHNARWPSGMAALHKDCMAAVRWRDYLYVRSRPCSNPDGLCEKSGVSQCGMLRKVEKGETKGTYTKNAQFIWGVTPGDDWALYNVRKDPGCRHNIAGGQKEIIARLGDAYNKWWDGLYPDMIAAGGDAPLSESALSGLKRDRKKTR
jgi:arylsulfatase A-like enzyme